MTVVNFTLSMVIASAIVLSGCASSLITSGGKDYVRCRTGKPLTCDHIKSTGVRDNSGHVRCRTAKPITCDHIRREDAHDTSGPSFSSHSRFKDKPWLGEIVLSDN